MREREGEGGREREGEGERAGEKECFAMHMPVYQADKEEEDGFSRQMREREREKFIDNQIDD